MPHQHYTPFPAFSLSNYFGNRSTAKKHKITVAQVPKILDSPDSENGFVFQNSGAIPVEPDDPQADRRAFRLGQNGGANSTNRVSGLATG